MYTLGGFYAYFKLEEDKGVGERSLTNCELLKDVLNIKETVSNFKFIVEPNGKLQTRQMLAILVVATLATGPLYGQDGVLYLYTRLQFNWNEIDFSIFGGYCSVIHTIGNCCVLAIFSKWLQYDDAILGAVASISKICAGIAYIMANTVLWFYISALLDIPVIVAIIASRSIITKLVLEKDLGKITSLFGIAESIGALICAPMYSSIFKATIDTFPGLFYVAGISLSVPAVLIFLWLYTKRKARYPLEV
ncbi:hypothetical protein RI129_003454 [Pyrocoelia pectoralis]|uniref:Solute carrier family 46 member 3 n=1 Tax=Pyrocoelia pectoralis TaxID=417401 RepID=A0AAN7ZN18_9COLE